MKTKTRSHKTPGLLAAALTVALFLSPQVLAQFNKFKSKTRFNPQQVQPVKPSESNNFQGGQPQENQAGANENQPSGNQAQNFEEDRPNQETFGARPAKRPPPGAKESKYVQLNPETAFGPEVIKSFDFPDTDIMELTKHMQELTGINLILDKDVKGKVSIMAPSPITVGDAWKAYLAALNMAGYTLVKSGEFYKVINARDVRYVPTAIYTGAYTPDTEAHVMKILALKNVDASEISRNFRPFMSRYGRIIDIKQTNTIIISDTGANINRLEKLIKFLDVPGHEESLRIIPVKNSSAQEIAKLLDEILRESSGGRGGPRARGGRPNTSSRFSGGDKSSNISKIIAEQRTNSIIAMANAEGARQLRDLIKKLDVKLVSQSSGRIHVHYLNYGNAEELAKTLSTLISGASASSGGASASARARAIRGRGEAEDDLFSKEVKVTADKNNNALVVTASPTDWLTLKNVIAKLDIPRDQVYVEGIMMETSLTKVRAFGVEYLGAHAAGNANRAGFLAGGGLVDLMSGNPTNLSGFFLGGGTGGTVEIPNPAGGDPLTVNSVNGLIKAIATNTSTNVLATPQILAMDNTEAEFEVGETVPVRKTVATDAGVQTSTEFQEAKLSLKITPQINKVTRFVKLKINQQINDFKGETDTSGNGQATTTRSAITEIMVKDKDTIAMGGLLRDREEVSFSKVPLLGDIPVLGWLFKNKSRTVNKVNLLMFLTPKILSPYEEKASAQTLATIEKSAEAIKKTIIDGDEPFEGEMTSLAEKIKIQAKQNIDSNNNIYQEINESEGIKRKEAPVDEPNYQEIIQSIEN
ncbi:MAG: type II secretion system secretin GspD [Bacteriovoracaceae bacterium]